MGLRMVAFGQPPGWLQQLLFWSGPVGNWYHTLVRRGEERGRAKGGGGVKLKQE